METDLAQFAQFRSQHSLNDALLVPYGSHVYGTASPKSDRDFLAIVPDNYPQPTGAQLRRNQIDVQIYHRTDFWVQLQEHKIHTLEAYYHPNGLVAASFDFELDLGMLRHQLSEKASHSWVKAKKKIEVEKDYYIGWKSLFHSLRILNFGIQIARTGRICNYGAANQIWADILAAQYYNWELLKAKFQPEYNRLASEFRSLAPKEGHGKETEAP